MDLNETLNQISCFFTDRYKVSYPIDQLKLGQTAKFKRIVFECIATANTYAVKVGVAPESLLPEHFVYVEIQASDNREIIQEKLLALVKTELPLIQEYLAQYSELERLARIENLTWTKSNTSDKEGIHTTFSCKKGQIYFFYGAPSVADYSVKEWIVHCIVQNAVWAIGYFNQIKKNVDVTFQQQFKGSVLNHTNKKERVFTLSFLFN